MPTTPKKTDAPAPITDEMFVKHFSCPHWVWFDAHGDGKRKAKANAFAVMLLESAILNEKAVIADLAYEEPKGRTDAARAKATAALMAAGVERIYKGTLIADGMVGRPDLLEKRLDHPSNFGAYHYVPIVIRNADRVDDAAKAQLCFYGDLLKAVQGRRPERGWQLNAAKALIGFPLRDFERQYRDALAEMRDALDGRRPPPHLSSGCKQSPWFAECKRFAEENDDVALLYNVKKRYVMALREMGVRTVADAARINPARLADASRELPEDLLERVVVQARALIENRHFVRHAIELPESPFEIFFDIEGDPLRQVEYLFGFLVRQGGEEKYVAMLAEKPEHERRMWEEFLEWIASLPQDYVVYHYGDYERSRIDAFEDRYGGAFALEGFRDRMVDLNVVVKDSIVFPLYFYGLKDIGEYVGFVRKGKIKAGGESVAVYEEWLATGNRRKLDDIVRYNKEDVVATRYLKDWLAHEKRKPHDAEN